jgi:hypothetical protein
VNDACFLKGLSAKQSSWQAVDSSDGNFTQAKHWSLGNFQAVATHTHSISGRKKMQSSSGAESGYDIHILDPVAIVRVYAGKSMPEIF